MSLGYNYDDRHYSPNQLLRFVVYLYTVHNKSKVIQQVVQQIESCTTNTQHLNMSQQFHTQPFTTCH